MTKEDTWKRGHKAHASLLMLSYELFFLSVFIIEHGVQDSLLENGTQAGGS